MALWTNCPKFLVIWLIEMTVLDPRFGHTRTDQVENASKYLNREISWLDFANRLLDLACQETLPLFERIKFMAIFGQGLDEFFQVRVAGLKDQVAAGLAKRSPDGATAREQLTWIKEKVDGLLVRQDEIFLNSIIPSLSSTSIVISKFSDLDDSQKLEVLRVFDEKIYPILTPLAVDQGHPFPYISNLSLNLAVTIDDGHSSNRKFSRVKVPPLLGRFIRLAIPGDVTCLLPTEEVIANNLDGLFPGMKIRDHYCFRVTRNVDLSVDEDEAEDLLSAVEIELRRRRFGRAVRLEVQSGTSSYIEELLIDELELERKDVYRVRSLLDYTGLWDIASLDRPDLKLVPWTPRTPKRLINENFEPENIFKVIAQGDLLVHHPYESFSKSVESFVDAASQDPDVLAIKQTLYRTSGDSPIVQSLIRAAESGKQVAVLVELKARFDEKRNIEWARALEKAGVHVVYGLLGLKTHAKTTLVIRSEEGRIRRYCHIGTGNYNPSTAQSYEDLGLLTCSDELGSDLGELFNYLTGYSKRDVYQKIIVAPSMLLAKLSSLIEQQSKLGSQGYIAIKVNGLTHPAIIDDLYEASNRGVRVDLIVRGVCMLRPGVPGMSENIQVRSIVGRFLEHSRIFCFGTPEGQDHNIFIGSADLMERNLEHRVEVITPVEDRTIKSRLWDIIGRCLRDDVCSWSLTRAGTWVKNDTMSGFSCQDSLIETSSLADV